MHRLIFSIFAISLATNCSLADKLSDTKCVQEQSTSTVENNTSNNSAIRVQQAIDKIIPIIKDGLEKTHIPGGYLIVTQKDKIVCVVSFGNTTIANNNPKLVDNNTVFPVSSISKNITAFLVGALVDDCKIKWEDKVRKYDEDFFLHSEELSSELTIQDLISHCSGFKHFSADSLWSGGYPCNKIVDSFKYLNQKPGVFRKYYGYQNVIFGLIGSILEKATGEKYEDLVKKYLFDKMDMNDSSAIDLKYETSRISHMKYLASRFKYDISKNGFFSTTWNFISSAFTFKPKHISLSHSRYMDNIYPVEIDGYFHVFPATAGLSFSANDFAKFVQMVLNGGVYNNKTIVTKKTFNKITSKITELNNIKDDDLTFKKERFPRDDMSYGIGTFITKYGDNGNNTRKVIFHMGGACGAASFYIVSPDDDIGVGCVVNLGGVSHTLFAEYMCNNFLDLYFGFKGIDWLQAELDRKQTVEEKTKAFEKSVKQVLAPMKHINNYVGTYTSDIYGDINVTLNKDNKLVISNGIKSTELQHVNGNIFKFPSKNMLISYFDSDEYVAFKNDKFNNIGSFYISCFSEGNTVFKRKDERNNDASAK
ncbi:MAG: serine hydrolase [Alphaproteobacteria bacterium]|nr:serine hydrolase [Alphaproteobacteria bacterium]